MGEARPTRSACLTVTHLPPVARSGPAGDGRGRSRRRPRGPDVAGVTADWSPMFHVAWSRTAFDFAFTAEGCALRQTQRRPPAAPAPPAPGGAGRALPPPRRAAAKTDRPRGPRPGVAHAAGAGVASRSGRA